MQIKHRRITILAGITATLFFTSPSQADVNKPELMKQYFLNLTRDAELDVGAKSGWLNDNTDIAGLISRGMDLEARSLGVRSGTLYAENQIKKVLEYYSDYLDEIFDVSLYLDTYKHWLIVPAMVSELDGRKRYLDGGKVSFTYADKTYIIQRDPYFVDRPPSWRDYVRLHSVPPQIVSKKLLPKTAEEIERWQREFNAGWRTGIDTAIQNVNYQLTRGLYDLQGMQRYTMLNEAGLITDPIFQDEHLPVSGTNRRLDLNGGTVTMTVVPKMITDSKNYKPIPQLPPLESLLPRHFTDMLNQIR
ncbi:type IV secretory system conjugative DNA transfer family protein [Vibrio mediterranei]|uniref:type IV secretory system conjugative DNA transfer family protein n=1 Tax=Vibrio mediterranei TaxID=689 RepID=UPI0038CF1E9E